ncbi:MAG: hypothetical protein J1G05_06010 [Clostridiales bacterium]|nr:hypothetical protein [Clostridiales bacterium]
MTEIEKDTKDALAAEIEDDFLRRREERRSLERSWQLNMNFVSGNQYCDLDGAGEIIEEDKKYYWQFRRVFNHIAPIVDTRLAKLARIRPALTVRAASDDEDDRHSASLASAILAAVQEDGDIDGVISKATIWSEICGTAFYKVMWNADKGKVIGVGENGAKLKEGGVDVVAVSPFEIYPECLSAEKIQDQVSIIHARAVPVEDIFTMYGVRLEGRDIDEFSLAPIGTNSNSPAHMPQLTGVKRGYEVVLERYERPTSDLPEGRLAVAAGGKLLYEGPLPYINGEENTRTYPFVKQVSVPAPGSFFGASVVERLIPLQRAYNAVKNRKHEFLNRITMGTVAVEDGSVDADELSEDGLVPGKIIVYRQGTQPPEMLQLGGVPDEFWKEEESLINEFTKISGTGSLTENTDKFSGVTSATGLQLIIDQDDARLSTSCAEIKRALKIIGRHILRIYRQFASDLRLMKYSGNNTVNLICFKGSDISSDDVVFEADTDLNMTTAQKRTVIYDMLDRGLFADENGRIGVAAKNKILELLGYGSLANERDLSALNRARASEENLKMRTQEVEVKEYDDHQTHILEHTACLLSENLQNPVEQRIYGHVLKHKQLLNAQNNPEKEGQNE